MSLKLSPDGKFIPFRGWTTISPIRHHKPSSQGLQAQSQSIWTNLLSAASKLIRSAPCASNFACLPEESMHMTLTGLTEERNGIKPIDMQSAPWPEIEAALIQRAMPFFDKSYISKISHHTANGQELQRNSESAKGSGVRMKFGNVKISSVICIDLVPETPEMEDILYSWKMNVLKATGLSSKIVGKGKGMAYHITLAYRAASKGDMKDEENLLQAAIKKLFQSSTWIVPALLLNPPVLCSFPDMLQFPTQPLYPVNQPLHWLMKQSYGYEMVATEPKFELLASNPLALYSMNLKVNSTESPYSISGLNEHLLLQAHILDEQNGNSIGSTPTSIGMPSISNLPSKLALYDSKPSCGVIILGRALENGKVTETLENRLCRGFQVYMESKSSNLYGQVFMILCGGFTARGFEISEAMAMKKWLLSKFAGIPDSDLILEDNSLTTVENAIFVRNIIMEHPLMSNMTQLKLVTTQSHLSRATFLFSNLLCLPHIAMDSIPCLDADPNDAAIESHKSRSDYAFLLKRSLMLYCSAFFRSSILEMVKRNRYHDLKQFIKSTPMDTIAMILDSTTDLQQNNSLHFSVIHCRPKCLALLLQSGANVFSHNQASKTPLDLALAKPDLNVVSILLAHTARQISQNPSNVQFLPLMRDIPMSVQDGATAAAIYMLIASFQKLKDKPQAFVFSLSSNFEKELLILKSHVNQHCLSLSYENMDVFVQQGSVATSSFAEHFLKFSSSTRLIHPGTEVTEFLTTDQVLNAIKPKPKFPLLVVLDKSTISSSLSSTALPFSSMGYDTFQICL